VTEIARSMVMRYGMVKSLGHVAYEEERPPSWRPLPSGHREYSEATAREIDVAVRQIVDGTYEKAISILRASARSSSAGRSSCSTRKRCRARLEELRRAVSRERAASQRNGPRDPRGPQHVRAKCAPRATWIAPAARPMIQAAASAARAARGRSGRKAKYRPKSANPASGGPPGCSVRNRRGSGRRTAAGPRGTDARSML
jgi:hypothetical protein